MPRRHRSATGSSRSRPHIQQRRPLRFEPLEDRRLLSITVTALVDEADGSITDGDVSLRDAIALAPDSETINFSSALFAGGPGTLTLTLGEIKVLKSVSIIGPGAQFLTIDASGNDPSPNVNNGNGSRVFLIDDGVVPRRNVLLQGLTLTGADFVGYAGAIRSFESLTLRGMVFHDNAAANGAAIGSAGPLFLYDSEFYENHASASGGAIQISAGVFSTEIVRTTIRNNTTAGPGGGIYFSTNRTGVLNVIDSLIQDNDAGGDGGGIASVGLLVVTGSAIVGNDASGQGGGILAGSNVTIERSFIDDNSATHGGGLRAGGNVNVKETTISNNTASLDGGGILVSNTNLSTVFTQVTVSGNQANGGGGGMFLSQPTQIRHSTIAGNQANANNSGGEHGGGIQYVDATDPEDPLRTVTLEHTIVADNTRLDGGSVGDDLASGAGAFATAGSTFGLRYSLVEVSAGFNQRTGTGFEPFLLDVDPQLGPLVNNGGPTLPGGYTLLTHAAFPGSVAINAGDAAAVAGVGGVPEFDPRGTPWSRVAGGRIDIGATESNSNPKPGDYNYDGVINAADYTLWRDMRGAASDPRPDGSGPQMGIPDGVVDELDYNFWKAKFISALPGDYSYNRVVDAADYTVWRDTLGVLADLRADGSGSTSGVPDGLVDTHDYTFWKSQFNNTLYSATSGGAGGGAATAGEELGVSAAAWLATGRQAGPAATNAVHVPQSTSDASSSDALLAWMASRATVDSEVAAGDSPLLDGDGAEDDPSTDAFDRVFALLGSNN